MDEEAPINPFSGELAGWPFIVAMIFILFAAAIYGGEKQIHLRVEAAEIPNQVTISTGDTSARIYQWPAESDFALFMRRDESIDVKILASLPEKQADTIPENSTLSDNKEKAEHRFSSIIFQASNQYQIDPALIKAIIMAESGYDPKAISKKGAMGLMQLMPQTAEALGVKDCFNPEHNIIAGVRYFRQLMNQFEGDIKLALAAYNAGGSMVRKYQGVPPYRATQYYIKKVFEYYQYYKNQVAEEVSRA